MNNLFSNIEIETAFKDYCKGCSVCKLEVEQIELNTSIRRYILHCKHAKACERLYKLWKTKKEKN